MSRESRDGAAENFRRATLREPRTHTIALTFIAVGGVYAKGPSSAAAYYYGGKITICHHAGPHGKTVTITVSESALQAHLRHGDTVGPCP